MGEIKDRVHSQARIQPANDSLLFALRIALPGLRCSVMTVFPPIEAVGFVQVISSPLIAARCVCLVPSQFGNVLPTM